MLSNQQHYDWGLRAIKTVLKGCGDSMLKKRQKVTSEKLNNETRVILQEQEYEIILNAIQLNTMSKLTFADSQRFRLLLDDIFPGADKVINHVS